ncbi:MAG: GNAT family N-acetyltransferase [Anaerolineae bacterium]|nr:GNAT family N-acetyltransferase [Anaerolineae bacterium]
MHIVYLTGLWQFQPDMAGVGETLGFTSMAYDDARWRWVKVPSDFETCHPSLEAYEGGAWYRRRIFIPDTWEEKHIYLHFEGVYARINVWINGQLVGAGDLPYLPMDFDTGQCIVPGEANLFTLWVDNTRLPGEVPGRQRGWRTFGGLLREIRLVATDKLFIDTIIPVAEPDDQGGRLTVKILLRNQYQVDKVPEVNIRITDKAGKIWEQLDFPSRTVGGGASVVMASDIAVPGAHLWSPGAPHLYTLQVTLREDGRILAQQQQDIGFRSIETRADKLYLNGQSIILTGFNRHEDTATRNMCPDLKTARADLAAMKEAGANFVRLCHYPHHPDELAICDELGLLVMDEIPLYWWDGLAEGEKACAMKLNAAEKQMKALIRRDRGHPSVIFWSVSNETEEQRPEVVAGNNHLIQVARKMDPSRLVVHVSNHWQDNPHFEYDDVICVNGYPTWWEQVVQHNLTYTAQDGRNHWRKNLAQLHERYPGKPILVTEFGFVSLPNVYDVLGGEDAHAEVIEAEYEGMKASYVCGATVWCWADHAWPPATFDFANRLGISPFGVVDRNRRKKKPYWIIRQLFREKQGVGDMQTASSVQSNPAGRGIYMVRNTMDHIPQFDFPEGYNIRPMRLDEGGLWTDIWRDADPYTDPDPQMFHNEFSYDIHATTWRSYIVTDPRGLGVGVISAWYNQQFMGGVWGMIHWVALRRSVWGLGLGKAMMTYAMNQLARWHDRAYLGTQTNRLPAIKNYLDFGFQPYIDPPAAKAAWCEVARKLHHPALDGLFEVDIP